jgi:hypothetical protein
MGLLGQDDADWESAIFNFKWCREILKLSRTAIDKEILTFLISRSYHPSALIIGIGFGCSGSWRRVVIHFV